MCYNAEQLELASLKYAVKHGFAEPEALTRFYERVVNSAHYWASGFNHPSLLIINDSGIAWYEWGLIPHWCKDISLARDIQNKTLNAVGETVFEKPSFKKSILSQRCLLPVSGFYEWREFNKQKYPYHIHLKSDEVFCLGCIYDTWVDKNTGEVITTFAILTTPANPLMEKIHNLKKRMPLIIPQDQMKNWVDPELPIEDIKELLKPYDEADMEAYTISKTVNNTRNNRNVPESLERVEYPELTPL